MPEAVCVSCFTKDSSLVSGHLCGGEEEGGVVGLLRTAAKAENFDVVSKFWLRQGE